jgi:hypothetical protein
MPRRGPRRITVLGVGTPPPVTREILRPLAMEVLRTWEAKQAADREAKRVGEDRPGSERKGRDRKRQDPDNRLDLGSFRPRARSPPPIR